MRLRIEPLGPAPIPRAGFDWKRVRWGKPYEHVTRTCSYCNAKLGLSPLRLFSPTGQGAAFCRACQKDWWGIETFDDD